MVLFHNKKGQFYIFMAVVFCSLALLLILSNFGARGLKPVYNDLKNNFVKESHFVINSALYGDVDLMTRLNNFISYFSDYSKSRNVDFNVLYLLSRDDVLYVTNYLDEDVGLSSSYGNYNILSNSTVILDKDSSIYIDVDDVVNKLDFDDSYLQTKIYFKLGDLN
jgi:hypothetical protein